MNVFSFHRISQSLWSVVTLFLLITGTARGEETPSTPQRATQEDMTAPPIDGSLSVGYASQYEYRGMALHSSYAQSGGMIFEAQGHYTPVESLAAPLISLTYRDMQVGGSEGQTNFVLGQQFLTTSSENKKFSLFKLGYQLTNGGIGGMMTGWRKGELLNEANGTLHEIMASYSTYASLSHGGYFSEYTAGYSFSGLTGWSLSAALGYTCPIYKEIYATCALTANWSFSYWSNTSGLDSIGLLLTSPCPLAPDKVLTPFLQLNWGGRGAKLLNSEVGTAFVKNFALIAGMKFSWEF